MTMRLLVLASFYPEWKRRDYSGIFVEDELKALAKSGYAIYVVAGARGKTGQTVEGGVTVHRVRRYFFGTIDPLSALSAMRRMKFDIVQAAWADFSGAYTSVAKRMKNKPMVLNVQGFEVQRIAKYGLLANPVLSIAPSFSIRSADVIVVHSSYLKSLVLAEYEVPPERIRVVPPVLRESFLESIPEDSQNETILTVTRLVRGKGIERALRAVDALRRQLPEIRYLIVGDGPMIGKYKQLATELGLERCVKFVGEVPPTEVHRYYEKCTVYLLPSLLESFGISKIEANACGKPVIAANADGVREGIVHGVNGFLFNNDEEIPYYILKLLTDSKLLRSMQSNAKEASREYSPASYVSRMSRIYSTVS